MLNIFQKGLIICIFWELPDHVLKYIPPRTTSTCSLMKKHGPRGIRTELKSWVCHKFPATEVLLFIQSLFHPCFQQLLSLCIFKELVLLLLSVYLRYYTILTVRKSDSKNSANRCDPKPAVKLAVVDEFLRLFVSFSTVSFSKVRKSSFLTFIFCMKGLTLVHLNSDGVTI